MVLIECAIDRKMKIKNQTNFFQMVEQNYSVCVRLHYRIPHARVCLRKFTLLSFKYYLVRIRLSPYVEEFEDSNLKVL